MTTQALLEKAKAASTAVAAADTRLKNEALAAMADGLINDTDMILQANAADVAAAKGHITDVMIDRLTLTEERIEGMAAGIREMVALPDPIGEILSEIERPNGLIIRKTAVPLGVIAIIYESRPNVTSDATALCIKSGNACVLRSGKEAHKSSAAIVTSLQKALARAGLPEDAIVLIEDTSRESANELMRAVGFIDLLIPRGGKGLIENCVKNALVPCIHTGDGICHVYVDRDADFEKAVRIVQNAKTSRPSVCNAIETTLVHRGIAQKFLPMLKERLSNVELVTDEAAHDIIGGTPATKDTFDTEYLDYKMSVGIVSSVDEAIRHIARHGTHHSDAIVTENRETARYFTRLVDSAAVYVNASTRFTDGGEFGLGCEMGISTQKLHARGPMGLKELTTYKYIIEGNGQIR